MPDSVTQILAAGPVGVKQNIAVLGDGFAAGDQAAYNTKIDDLLLNGVFVRDYFLEDKSAFNIFRVNLISNESGISTREYDEKGTPEDEKDDTIISTTLLDTALGYIYNGSWAHCWMEGGVDTGKRVQQALATWVPDYDLVVVILNTTKGGGCGGGGFQVVTRGSGWATMAHEFGHGTGGLRDEYCKPRVYSEGEPGAVNVTVNTNRATLKWKNFVAAATPVPTGATPVPGKGNCADYNQGAEPAGWSNSDDAGLFEGGGTYNSSIYRPVVNCRMRGNSPPYCPVCYTEMKRRQDKFTGHTFYRCVPGNFFGDGKDGLLVHDGNSILLHRSTGNAFEVVFSAVERVPGSWQFAPDDQFLVADFDGDGRDEVVVFNGTNWDKPYLGLLADDGGQGLRLIARYDGALPNWQMGRHDHFMVGDFNGDGKADLFVWNGADWSNRWLGMFASTGAGFSYTNRYENDLGGWQMGSLDQYHIGDYSGNGMADVFVFNGHNWSSRWFGMFRSTGSELKRTALYENSLAGWQMASGDRHFVGDFDGDGKADFYISNSTNWNISYLGMMKSDGTGVTPVQVYNGAVPGWQLSSGDRFHIADTDGNGRADLVVYNCTNWDTQYLGTMTSSGSGVSCALKKDWVGEWNLGLHDHFEPCDYGGMGGQRNLVVHNRDWLGLMKSTGSPTLQRLYYRWVHNYRHGRNW